MTSMNEVIKSIIRIEKETYDLHRLLDQKKLDVKTCAILKRCATEASKNLRMLEEKYWHKEPSLATFLQHFVPEFEHELNECNECILLENLKKDRETLLSLYSNLSEMDEDPELSDMFKDMAKRAAPLSAM
jgi:hypothetical protein